MEQFIHKYIVNYQNRYTPQIINIVYYQLYTAHYKYLV